MPEAILKFSLPDEKYEFNCAKNGMKYHAIISELMMEARNAVKYQENKSEKVQQGKQEMYEALWKVLESHNFDPWGYPE